MTTDSSKQAAVQSLHVIYDADGSLAGEIVYMAKKLLGLAHCAACDITHGPRAEKPEFTELKQRGWTVPVVNIHRDEMDSQMRLRVDGHLPCVVARVKEGDDIVVVGPSELERCDGALDCFERAVEDGARRHGLALERGDLCGNRPQVNKDDDNREGRWMGSVR